MEAEFVQAAKGAMYSDHTVTMLAFMKQHGSSVTLGWGEDTSFWECCWITGGDRYRGACSNPADACRVTIEHMLRGKKAAD